MKALNTLTLLLTASCFVEDNQNIEQLNNQYQSDLTPQCNPMDLQTSYQHYFNFNIFNILGDNAFNLYLRFILDDEKTMNNIKELIFFSYQNQIDLVKVFEKISTQITIFDLLTNLAGKDSFRFFSNIAYKNCLSSSVFNNFCKILISIKDSILENITNNGLDFYNSIDNEAEFRKNIFRYFITFIFEQNKMIPGAEVPIFVQQVRTLLTDHQYDVLAKQFLEFINQNQIDSKDQKKFANELSKYISLRCQNILFIMKNICLTLKDNDKKGFGQSFDDLIEELKLICFNKATFDKYSRDEKHFMYRYELVGESLQIAN